MAYGQKFSGLMRKNLGERVGAVNVCNFGGAVGELSKTIWRFGLKDVAVIVREMMGKVFELKEGLTWVRKMEVEIWSFMIVTSMMMMIGMIVGIIGPPIFS